jgi:hypothetical protein
VRCEFFHDFNRISGFLFCLEQFSSLAVQYMEFRNAAKKLTLTREEKPDGLGLRQSSAALGA